MTHYIRDDKNNTILDLEVYMEDGLPDLSAAIDIGNYSKFLLNAETKEEQRVIIHVFDSLSEARGWYWEQYRELVKKDPTIEDVNEAIGTMVSSGAETVGLKYVTD